MATNNVEGLQDALIEAAGSLANYNSEQGRFEITGVNLRRAKEMAAQLGVDYKELTKSAIASQERLAASSDLMAKGFNMDEKDKEFLINMSRMDGGRMVIDVPRSLQESLGIKDTQVALTDLTDAQANQLKEYQKQMGSMTSEEVARDQFESITNIQRDVNSIVTMARLQMTNQIRNNKTFGVDSLTKDLKDQITEYTNKVQRGESGTVLEKLKQDIQTQISDLESTGLGSIMTEKITSLSNKLKDVSKSENVKENVAPNTALPDRNVKVKVDVGITQAVTDAASQALIQNKDIWNDILQRQEKDYLSL